jgi:hypothetical protein
LRLITLRDTHTHTLGRIPLDEGSVRRRDLYLTKHNTHKRQTSMPGQDSNQKSQQAIGRRPTPYNVRSVSPFADPNVDKTAKTQLVRTHSLHVERQRATPPPTAPLAAVARKNTGRIRVISGTGLAVKRRRNSGSGSVSEKYIRTSTLPPATSSVTVARAQKLR